MLQLLWDTRGYLFWLWATGLAVFVLEKVWPWRKQRVFRRQLFGDLLFVAFNGHYFGVLFGVYLNQAFEHATDTLGLPATRAWNVLADLPIAWQFAICFPAKDFLEWCVHNLLHRVPWFWQFHKVHHSIEELDWLAAYRVHPIDQILTMTASLGPVFLLGFAPEATAIMAIIYRWHSLLIHSNVDLRFGPLRHVFASPRFHHWHHANHEEAFDRNFAGQLAFIDRIFGTLYLPHDRMPKRYGVDDPPPMDYIGQLISPLKPAPPKDAAVSGAQS